MATIKLQNGKVITKLGKASCTCCGGYTLCVDNTNLILDNSWNIDINGNYVGFYDGGNFSAQCFNIPFSFLNQGEPNSLNFTLSVCQSDDYFEFYILDLNGEEIYRDNSGFLNGSFFINGTCEDTFFSREFTL